MPNFAEFKPLYAIEINPSNIYYMELVDGTSRTAETMRYVLLHNYDVSKQSAINFPRRLAHHVEFPT